MRRRILRVVLVIIASLALIVSGLAFAGSVRFSKHDFSISSYLSNTNPQNLSNWAGVFQVGGQDIDEVCVFCHTPHNANQDSARGLNTFLWNRSVPTRTYTPYSSLTLSASVSTPTSISLMCMSCHDGVTSIAANTLLEVYPPTSLVTFNPANLQGTPGGNIGSVWGGQVGFGWGPNIGNLTAPGPNVDLSNDHPVSFNWPSGDTGLHDLATYVKVFYPQLKLYGGSNRMECSTCHDVHNPDIRPFLVMSNSQSAMCLACHNK